MNRFLELMSKMSKEGSDRYPGEFLRPFERPASIWYLSYGTCSRSEGYWTAIVLYIFNSPIGQLTLAQLFHESFKSLSGAQCLWKACVCQFHGLREL